MITKIKSPKCHKHHRKQKHSLLIDVGKPKVPIHKASRRSSEKLEDWKDAS